MSTRPRLLDVYSCSGAASVGYHRAGFDVTGVDINPQPNYPYEFIQANALSYLADHGHEYDAIHASPPCQASSTLTKGTNQGRQYPQLIPATRELLKLTGRPWVIENVKGAPIRKDLLLCGGMFDLRVFRDRLFELDGFTAVQPEHIPHARLGRVTGYRHGVRYDGEYFGVYGDGGHKGSVADWQRAMGITHTDVRIEIAEAIPPAYSEYIGRHLIDQLEQEAAA